MAYPLKSEVFGSACEQLESLVCRLIGEIAGQMGHGTIEALILKEETELLWLQVQAYLDLRANRDMQRHDAISPVCSSMSSVQVAAAR